MEENNYYNIEKEKFRELFNKNYIKDSSDEEINIVLTGHNWPIWESS